MTSTDATDSDQTAASFPISDVNRVKRANRSGRYDMADFEPGIRFDELMRKTYRTTFGS